MAQQQQQHQWLARIARPSLAPCVLSAHKDRIEITISGLKIELYTTHSRNRRWRWRWRMGELCGWKFGWANPLHPLFKHWLPLWKTTRLPTSVLARSILFYKSTEMDLLCARRACIRLPAGPFRTGDWWLECVRDPKTMVMVTAITT